MPSISQKNEAARYDVHGGHARDENADANAERFPVFDFPFRRAGAADELHGDNHAEYADYRFEDDVNAAHAHSLCDVIALRREHSNALLVNHMIQRSRTVIFALSVAVLGVSVCIAGIRLHQFAQYEAAQARV